MSAVSKFLNDFVGARHASLFKFPLDGQGFFFEIVQNLLPTLPFLFRWLNSLVFGIPVFLTLEFHGGFEAFVLAVLRDS